MTLEGKVALVTGASGGIGRAVCRRLAGDGARIVAHYHAHREAAEEVLAELAGDGHTAVGADLLDPSAVEAMVSAAIDNGGRLDVLVNNAGVEAVGIGADIGNPDDIDRVVAATVERHGRLDVLVNNAGVYERHPPLESSFAEWRDCWRRTLGINLVGPANAAYCAARVMARQGGGRIVNVSSRGAFRGEPDAPAYGASKAGLNALSQSLAVALAPHGIGVYAVAPGFVETAMARPYLTSEMGEAIRRQSPLGRVATADDVAYWVACLAAPDAAYATGAIIDVNGASYLRS